MNPLLSKNFFLLITANCLAFCGWVFRNYLINWYILEKTNSTFMVGLIAAIPTFFVIFISPLGGQLADKFSRKKLFLIARIISFIFFLFAAIFIHANFYPIFFIILCFSGIGVTAGLEVTASRNLILDVVGFKYLTWGNSITEFINAFLSTTGPLVIAIFFTSISNTIIFFSMPAVHLISVAAAFMLFIYLKETKNDSDKGLEKGVDKSIKEGIVYSYKSVNIRILLILAFTILFWGATQPLIPKIARDTLGSGASGYATLLSSEAFGAMIGSIALPLFAKIFRNSKSIVACIIIYSIVLFFFSLSTSIYLSILLLIIGGFFHIIWFTVVLILLQTIPDDDHKGRVVGLFFTVIQAYGLGFILGGLLGESIGIVATITIAAIIPVIVHLVCYGASKDFRTLKS